MTLRRAPVAACRSRGLCRGGGEGRGGAPSLGNGAVRHARVAGRPPVPSPGHFCPTGRPRRAKRMDLPVPGRFRPRIGVVCHGHVAGLPWREGAGLSCREQSPMRDAAGMKALECAMWHERPRVRGSSGTKGLRCAKKVRFRSRIAHRSRFMPARPCIEDLSCQTVASTAYRGSFVPDGPRRTDRLLYLVTKTPLSCGPAGTFLKRHVSRPSSRCVRKTPCIILNSGCSIVTRRVSTTLTGLGARLTCCLGSNALYA